MNKVTTFVALGLAILAAAAWGADYVVERAPAGPEPTGSDGTIELKWDSGAGRWMLHWYTGADAWVGNDFDVSTIKAYGGIKTYRTQSRLWPNQSWDGFRIAIYAFSGSAPGSLLWGPEYFKPGMASAGWYDCAVGWTLPPGNDAFVAAVEQFYNFPNLDPFALDNNPTFRNHSWQYYGGSWQALTGHGGYRNLMLRAVVNNVPVGVTPTSVGRVKALYY